MLRLSSGWLLAPSQLGVGIARLQPTKRRWPSPELCKLTALSSDSQAQCLQVPATGPGALGVSAMQVSARTEFII